MNRPVTPENKFKAYQDYTICRTKQAVNVRLKDTTLPSGVYCPDTNGHHVLPPGSVVTVNDAQMLNFTGVNEAQSTENTGYRIEGEIKLTTYEVIEDQNQPIRLQHSHLQPVKSDCKPNAPYPSKTIVAIKQDIIYQRFSLPKGELFAIKSKAKTPRGQTPRSHEIDGAMYDVDHVRKQIRGFKVKNSSNVLVVHNELERIT